MVADETDSRDYVTELYQALLKRAPHAEELAAWVGRLDKGMSHLAVLRAFLNSPEHKRRVGVPAAVPNGHFYSPVVDPEEVKAYFEKSRNESAEDVAGIDLDVDRMWDFWQALLPHVRSTPFEEDPNPANRYYYDNKTYPCGDAITLRAIVAHFRPRRIIEVGSGFSTACVLDTIDHFDLSPRVTAIDPYPGRLLDNLREGDLDRLELLEKSVQDVPPELFDELGANDILIIDSTHVLKTGSDVHFELFKILPRLRPGVVVHVHDIPFPFEYHPNYIYAWKYSWNEAYALRAFLMYNSRFSVLFWNSMLSRLRKTEVESDCLLFKKNPGSGMWIRVEGEDGGTKGPATAPAPERSR